MPPQSKFFDYEPVTRSQGSRALDAEELDLSATGPEPTDGLSNPRFVEVPVESMEEQPLTDRRPKEMDLPVKNSVKNKAKVVDERGEGWILKRGHAVSFAGLFLFTFLVFFRPYELLPSLAWLSQSAFWVAIATLIVFIPTQLGLENKITAWTTEVKLVLLLLGLGLLSVPFATDQLKAWTSFTEYSKVVVMFIVMANVVRTEKRLKALMLLILTATCILSIAAINDYATGKFMPRGDRIEGLIGGLFDNPNDLAIHFVTFVPITVGLALGSRSLIAKVLYLLSGILATIGIVVTFSRGGFLGLVFALGVLVWRLLPRNRVLFVTIGALLIGLFFVIAPGAYRSRIGTTSDASALARTDELKRSIFIALRHPILGVGMDNFTLYSNDDHATHNAYTQVASEMGLAAAAIYLLFLISTFKRLSKIGDKTNMGGKRSRLDYLAIALQASLVGYMVSSFFASVAYLWYVYYIVAYSICASRLYHSSAITGKMFGSQSVSRFEQASKL